MDSWILMVATEGRLHVVPPTSFVLTAQQLTPYSGLLTSCRSVARATPFICSPTMSALVWTSPSTRTCCTTVYQTSETRAINNIWYNITNNLRNNITSYIRYNRDQRQVYPSHNSGQTTQCISLYTPIGFSELMFDCVLSTHLYCLPHTD